LPVSSSPSLQPLAVYPTVLSTNIGQAREVIWQGAPVMTGIYKEPVDAIRIRKFFVEGDSVSDLQVHGGERKAVYGYPSEHYEFWMREFPRMKMPWGTFGENITTEGVLENELMIGAVYRVGTALLQVTEPRLPCYKLAIKFGRVDIIQRFMKSRRTGFYFTVIDEGEVKPGDLLQLEQGVEGGESILDATNRHIQRKAGNENEF
jgi:MOSC domain-containing protein YiiM